MLMLSFEYSITLSQHALRPGTTSSMKMLILWPIQRILYKHDNAILYGWVIDNVIFVLGLLSEGHAFEAEKRKLEGIRNLIIFDNPNNVYIRSMQKKHNKDTYFLEFDYLQYKGKRIIDAVVIYYEDPAITLGFEEAAYSKKHGSIINNLQIAQTIKYQHGSRCSIKNSLLLNSYGTILTFLYKMVTRTLSSFDNKSSRLPSLALFNHLKARVLFINRINSQNDNSLKVPFTRSLKTELELCNFSWLVVLDVPIGLVVGYFLFKNADEISRISNEYLFKWTVVFFETYIDWLMGYPAGLKLNGNLNRFIGQMHMWLLSLWRIPLLAMPGVAIIKGLAILGMFGFTFVLCGIIDMLLLIMLPMTISYRIAARLFSWELTIMNSLFHLFRGKKWNVLRERLDSTAYDLDQLLLGTILFSVLVFVFPTIAVYYVLFLFSIIIWKMMGSVLELTFHIIDEFPFYELARRNQLVSGITIDDVSKEEENISKLTIKYKFKSIGTTLKPILFNLIKRQFVDNRNWSNVFLGKLYHHHP